MSGAALDPWCLVPTTDGKMLLFGFAVRHPGTGGLAWLRSTEVLELEAEHGRAVTRSGRQYALGRQFEPVDVGDEGEEPRVAFEVLVGDDYENMNGLREVDRFWLMACKAARHLAVAQPSRTQAALAQFFNVHQSPYLQLRRRQQDGHS